MNTLPTVGRRGLLLGGVALLGTGCSQQTAATSPTATPVVTLDTPKPSITTTPSPTPTPTAQWPTRAQIVVTYGKVAPREWGLEPTGVVLRQKSRHVCLTFDACGGPYGHKVDMDLINLLRKHKVKTTLFWNKRWIDANPKIAAQIAADPLFDIQNHGTTHLPLSVSGRKGYAEQGTHNAGEVYDEVMGSMEALTKLTGKRPRFFRSGTAHYDEVAVRIVRDLGMLPVNFSINGDAGTTFTIGQILQETAPTKAGDIVIGHMNQPKRSTAEGMAQVIPRMIAKGITFATLSEVL
ncbi:polysaccharide deacetylase family protein [Luteococcus sp. H138]|uniref:polysaccharide deacetylase family protein n=1 Tax=unclassified Luteococcus TaxID=2639923 RepID=UPI00313CE80F